jgi:N-acetyltransferase 10
MVYYIGTAFGLTKDLFTFWRKNEYYPVYLKLTENDITGEHSCIMLKPIRDDNLLSSGVEVVNEGKNINWLNPFLSDFKKRLITLLGFEFRSMSIKLSLSILDPNLTSTTSSEENANANANDEDALNSDQQVNMTKDQLEFFISKYDFKRLELYTKNLVKYQMVIDLIPSIAKLFFLRKFGNVKLSYTQAGILLGFGLQYKTFDTIGEEFNIQNNQLLAMFNKMIKKFTTAIRGIYEKEIDRQEKVLSGEEVNKFINFIKIR